MLNRAWILVAIMALPIALQAQRGRKFDPLPPKEGEFAPPPMPTAKEMEKGSPAAVLLDKRKKLQLSDSQVTALQVLTEDQKPKAREYWDDEDRENQKWMRGRGGRPPGRLPTVAAPRPR
jgi:hypothetical protein